MEFTAEEITRILGGEGDENLEKVNAILSLHEDSVAGLKVNRDDLKTEKESWKKKYEESQAVVAKGAEDLAELQKRLDSSSPEEIKKAYDVQLEELKKTYTGAIAERDEKIKSQASELEAAQKDKKYLKCVAEFDKASSKFDIDQSGRAYVLEMILGPNGDKFTERDLGSGLQLVNSQGRSIESSMREFFEQPVGKRFLLNGNSGGGASGGSKVKLDDGEENPFVTGNVTAQMLLFKKDPAKYEAMKKAASKA